MENARVKPAQMKKTYFTRNKKPPKHRNTFIFCTVILKLNVIQLGYSSTLGKLNVVFLQFF